MFDRLKQAANETKFKADQMLRVQRVQNDIAGVNQQMSAMRDRIGGRALELHRQGALAMGVAELEELCASVDTLFAQIGQKEAQIAAIKAEHPPTGATPAPQPGFQQQQGFPQQPGFQQQPQYAPPPPQVAMKTCPNCQAAVPGPAMFCTTCGFNFQPAPAAEAARATKTCASCQFEVPMQSAFCPNCGKPVA
ncbi:MAG: zinc ribbon domain-containing protein [Saprospiraceae bacterium]|nr:zinc ribbon domain-containing protein [Saprospiraceae bacterium]